MKAHEMRKLVIDALIYKKNKAFGYQEYLFNLLEYFYANESLFDFDEIIIICDIRQVHEFKKFIDVFKIIGLNASSKLNQLICQNLIKQKLKLSSNDVILYTYNYSSLFRQGIHVLVIHDLLYLRRKLLPKFLMRIQRRIFIPRSVKIADKIIAISNDTLQDVIANFRISSGKIVKIYNYFNFDKYKYISTDQLLDSPFFLSVCSTAYHKNTILVFRAFELFCLSNSVFHLVLVGSLGNSGSELREQYNKLDDTVKSRIHIFTNITNEQLAQIYQKANYYISATLFEGLGMPIIEAMYFNIPVLLSNLSVCHEVSSDMGIYFNPLSVDDLLQKMQEVINENMVVDTRDIVLEKYSEINTSHKYIELLNNIK